MSKARACVFCAALCLAVSPAASAEKSAKKLRNELRSAYEPWISQDVTYIITEEERQAFYRLANDEEREQFIEQFWLRRDPTPDTVENEFKEEHYRRIAYANDRFPSGIPGWKTDRGRIYIKYGPPDEIDSHPSGGSYQRPFNEGGGTTTAYPFETWRYRFIEGVGTDVVIEFVDPGGTGEYRIALEPTEKDALQHVPGYHPPDTRMMPDAGSLEFDRLKRYTDLQRPPAVRSHDLEAMVTSSLRFNLLPVAVRVDYLRMTDSTVLTPVTLEFSNRDLQFKEQNGQARAAVNVYLRVTSMSRRVVSVAEDVVSIDSAPDKLHEQADRSSLYQKTFFLPPGNYRLNVAAKDTTSEAANTLEVALRVPHFEQGRMAASSLVLADRIERLPARAVGSGQFVLGNAKVRPRVSTIFRRDEKLGMYFQVYEMGGDAAGKPSGSIEYRVTKRGSPAPVLRFLEEAAEIPGASAQQLTVEKLLPLTTFDPGDYSLTATVTDRSRNQSVSRSATFSVR